VGDELTFICGLCGETFSRSVAEDHHMVPQSVGGEDSEDNLIRLCSNCHTFIHGIARKIKKSAIGADDELNRTFPNSPKKRELAYNLAKTVMVARRDNKRAFSKVLLELPIELNRELIDRARLAKVSRDEYIIHLLQKHCRRFAKNGGESDTSVQSSSQRRTPKRKRLTSKKKAKGNGSALSS